MAYALVALGFVLALNAAGAVNFAHGDLVVLGGAVAVFVGLSTGLPACLLLPLVALALGVVGVVAARIAILPLASRPPEATFVATIALAAIIEQGLTIAMAGAPRTAPPLAGSGSFEIAGFVLGRQPLAIVVRGRRAGCRRVVPAGAHPDRPAHARRRRRPPDGARRRHSRRPLRHPVAWRWPARWPALRASCWAISSWSRRPRAPATC